MNFSKIILASASPRRKELLAQVGFEFDIIVAKGEEVVTSDIPNQVVMELSAQKAKEVAANAPKDALVIGADTVVALGNKILGKPKNYEEAFDMISSFKNGSHSVFTGVTLVCNDVVKSFYVETIVHVYDMTKEEIDEYILSGDCYDKAGAYGVQGYFSRYVKGIEGDYFNVVGLPVSRLVQEIKKMEV